MTKNGFRNAGQRHFHTRSYRNELLRKVKIEDTVDDSQNFYPIASDIILFTPIMELSCGRVKAIDYNNYIYNMGTGFGESEQKQAYQKSIHDKVYRSEKYQCGSTFGAKIEK